MTFLSWTFLIDDKDATVFFFRYKGLLSINVPRVTTGNEILSLTRKSLRKVNMGILYSHLQGYELLSKRKERKSPKAVLNRKLSFTLDIFVFYFLQPGTFEGS